MNWEQKYLPEQGHSSGSPISIEYSSTDGLLWLSVKNFLLTLVTLTLYRFWAKTNVRRHIWSNIRINGHPLEYTGTGMELFLGALVIFAIIGIPVIGGITAAQLMFGPASTEAALVQFVIIFGFLLLYGMAIYRARRYRLSRTLWRGIRGTLTGSPTSFSLLYFGSMLLKAMTLGWSTPAMNLNIQQRMIGDMTFGNKSFRFGGPAGPLYARYALCWFLTPIVIVGLVIAIVLVLGGSQDFFGEFSAGKWDEDSIEEYFNSAGLGVIFGLYGSIFAIYIGIAVIWTFYTVQEMNLFASYTGFDNAAFKLDATVGSLILLWLGNLAIVIFTLGIGQPFVVQRLVRYLCNRLSVDGSVDIAAIQQSTAAIDKHGEGLVDAFDIDAF